MKKSQMPVWVLAVMLSCAALMGASPCFAGPQAIGSCGKIISAPGSFVLTKDLAVKNSGQACITVTSSFVTVDLGGFTINCAGYAVDGVNVSGLGHTNLAVRNGNITGCFNGIDASVAPQTTIEGVTATNNSSSGIAVAAGSLVKDCVASGNTGSGISATCPSNVIDNASTGNTGADISVGSGCNVANNATGP